MKNILAPVELYHLTISLFVIKKAEGINARFFVAFRAITTLEFLPNVSKGIECLEAPFMMSFIGIAG